ncbi:hypothetical protein MXD59_22355 [Frankia sp. Ag45/Mut15]|uniref:Integral membrane protein n=1 Tax=Frankia umida TaxID=573489 RepID=A0ABT0K3W0_9ACTN|nr:hypothetical protein [Frankia umida]MCK9878473.1 hypothetical protein [Frankia umida]
MITGLEAAAISVTLVAALVCLVQTARDRAVGVGVLVASGGCELVLLAQAVAAVVKLIGGEQAGEPAVFVLYLIGSVLVLPAGVWWTAGERTRWGSAVLGVAFLAAAMVVVRMGQVWENTGG